MTQKILFLCPHNAAKSVIAAAYFNQSAAQRGLDYTADSAGTEPSPSVSPVVLQMLNYEGVDVSRHIPRSVTPEDLQNATRVISMGCSPEDLHVSPEQIELWDDVPPVSQEPERARDVIRAHVDHLITELEGNS